LLEGGTVILVRQYRAPIDEYLLEIPAGKRDVAHEDPITTAGRELAEEIGMTADHMDLLAEFYNSPGFSDERSYTYLAWGLHETPMQRDGIEEQSMVIEHVPLAAVPSLIHAGEITDAKTIIGLMMTRDRLGNPSPTVT
jgi:ADP-ribose pyrophosphatase